MSCRTNRVRRRRLREGRQPEARPTLAGLIQMGVALTGVAIMITLVIGDITLAHFLSYELIGVGIVFGASAWLLMAATLIALLQSWGLSWLQALLITSLLSLAVTGYAIWRVSYFFHHTGMHATRRQLSKLGLFDEPSEDDPDAEVQIPEGKP